MAMDCDWLIIGSGFGGSVSALRLTEKGYRVMVLEKGRRFRAPDFPKTNWALKRWLWMPTLGWRGLFEMSFFRHVTVLSGVGVGGGSLVYANTLPIPRDDFFQASTWGHLAAWKEELAPHYTTARRMLGATPNPLRTVPDQVLQDVGTDLGRTDFQPTTVAVYFGEPGVTVKDPYFNGEGPDRTGCTACGGCMLGCRFDAKNTLDKNYLHLAERRGLALHADTEVTWVRPLPDGGYEVEALQGARRFFRKKVRFTAKHVVFAGGVLGTLDLLLKLKASPDGLPRLSDRLGDGVRTNSEALVGVVSGRKGQDLSRGIAIGSILHTDAQSHLEPVRYSAGSGFFRLLMAPQVSGATMLQRFVRLVGLLVRHPLRFLKAWFVPDFARRTMILLYMRTLEGHLRMTRSRRLGLSTALQEGPAPSANMPEAFDLARRVADKLDGYPMTIVSETLLGIPTTAHILGGCCMGDSAETGVIDSRHRVFGHEGLYVVDGSAISANPGVNPSLTITALAERAMTFIPAARTAPRDEVAVPAGPMSSGARTS
ncbi:GMC oxidoreductase family protein [Myxococcus xanthus DK 1622]|uniref:Cholesterol oxidase n=2 Tax=Myxococcus TaxID=32 RepID=Q1D205_MYXXD|nr:GMC oxidoreductase family protein [Myxococcus xanthus DK 1622]QZZ52833.1 Cholesterol oxidase [Myxococcus xanthus]SDX56679.1 cholesterol oxidase [Myxococcus xanthus]